MNAGASTSGDNASECGNTMKYSESELNTMGLRKDSLPKHVAVIMDGNGRWAKARGMMRSSGHRAGVNALRDIIRFSSDAGIDALTVYAFSTENRKRPADEIGVLCSLLIEYFKSEIDELDANRVRIKSIGDLSWFPVSVQEAVKRAECRTADNDGLKLNIALNYGSQSEIVHAMKEAAEIAFHENRMPEKEDFENCLYTAGLPQVDLLIRTSGELRLSNFLLYQIAYAELYFTDTYWPDFSRSDYVDALKEYAKRARRFGGLSSESMQEEP